MSREVRRLAPSYFVQTPYFWFPIEPHPGAAFFHWVPESVRLSMLMRRPRGNWGKAPDVEFGDAADPQQQPTGPTNVETLFPDSAIICERFVGLTKSLIAIRRARDSGTF